VTDTRYSSVVESAQNFRFGLGHPVLEFVATLAGRRREPIERLARPGDLAAWLRLADVPAAPRGCTPSELAAAVELREAVFRLIDAARHGKRGARADRELVNRVAQDPTPTPRLDSRLRQIWEADEPSAAALAQLARMAIDLLAGPELGRIRNCANPSCSLMFIDHSRPGRRRWCSMDTCGNKTKTARYRRRTRPRAAGA
jgi:predicted RNA-binding Zn ribbon-like protein